MSTLECFEYDGEYFDVHFDQNNNIESIWMYVGGGFRSDLINVTDLMSEWFKTKAAGKFFGGLEDGDADAAYESFKDMQLDKKDGGAA